MSEQLTDEDLGLGSGLTDADLGLEEPALPRFAMQEAANSIPLPGYTTPFGQDIERTARALVQSQPSEQALEAGSFQNQRTLEPPPLPPGSALPAGDWSRGLLPSEGDPFAEPPPPVQGDWEKGWWPVETDPAWKTFPEEFAKARHEKFQSFAPTPEQVRSAMAEGVLTPEQIASMESRPVGEFPKAVAGGIQSVVNFAEETTKLENLPLLLAGGLPGKLGEAAMALFYADMVRHTPEVYDNVIEALRTGDTRKEAQALTDAVIHVAMMSATGLHGTRSAREGVDSFIKNNSPEARRRYYEQMRVAKQKADLAPLPQPESVEPSASRPQPPENAGEVPTTTSEVPLTLRPAIQALDQIVPGTAGKRHADILPEVTKTGDWAKMQAAIAGYNEGRGFVGPDGKFHTRKESQALLEDQYGPFEMIKPDEGLHSEDLNSKGQPKKLLVAKGVDVSKAEGPFTADEKQNMAKVLPLEDFKGELKDVPHYPVIIETEHGVRYPAYISEFYDMREVGGEVTPQVHKVTNSALPGEPPDIGLSSGGLGAKEKVVAGDYPKTVEAFKADIAAGVKPPRTLGETKPAAAPTGNARWLENAADAARQRLEERAKLTKYGSGPLHEIPNIVDWAIIGAHKLVKAGHDIAKWSAEMIREFGAKIQPHLESVLAQARAISERFTTPLPPDVAPAYEHGHAVASSVPGLLIDPFGFQSARMVGKAIKDIYDSPAVKKARQDVADLWNAAALKSAPKLTRSSRPLGEAGVRYASSHMVGRTKGQIFADKVLADSGIDPVKFGTALAEDNLRSIRAARDPAEAAKVRTLVGDETSPFKTEAEYQAFLKDPATQKALERHQQLWAEQKDPLYRQANDLDPHLPLATRGLQTGARINLKALQPDEMGVAPIGRRAPGFRQLATLKRRDPFGRQAKGSGLAYEGNYHEIVAHGFERELPVAAQHEFLKQLIEHGDAVVTDKMVEPGLELKGEATARGYLLSLKPYTGKFIHIRKGLADEFESISGLDKPLKLPIITAFNNFMTRQSVAGLAEGATHASNLMTQIFTMPGPTANPMLNALLKSVGRADLLVSLPKVLIKSFTNQRERMLTLAEIGAAKEPYPGAIAKKILNPIDQGVRLVSDDVFKALAKKGLVENTETNRREFINQVGQYNKRLQPLLTRRLRESGLQPFVTAGQTFNAQGLRRLAMAPGVKATSNIRALALRADVAAGWMGGIVLVTALNLLLSKKATGPVGTPLGSVGWVGDDRKVHTFNVFRLLGYERGARITGLGPYVEAKRQGLSPGQALTAGAQSVASTGLGMAMGPGPRFATIAATGQRPTQPWIKEAPRAVPSDSLSPLKSQMARNIQTAVIEANPVLSSAAEVRKEMKQGKPVGEALAGGAQKQITRYSPQTRMSEQKAAALPKIVDSVQLREYVDDVAKEARQLPMRERQHFINQRFRDDELGRKYRESAWQQIERKGVLKYR